FTSGPLSYLNGALWFDTNGVSTDEIRFWTSDGTPAGTLPFSTVSAESISSSTIALAGNTPVFLVRSFPGFEYRLYRTDGTPTGTELFRTFLDQGGSESTLMTLGDLLLFTARTPETTVFSGELWSTDATQEGTTQLTDLTSSPFSTTGPREITTVGDRAFFAAAQPEGFPVSSDRELWMTDGTVAGTQQVFDINTTSSSSPEDLIATNDAVVFTASTSEAGRELWLSRGPNDTYQIADLLPGPEDSGISELFAVGGTVFFSANDNVAGEELWRSDGTLEGTRLAADVVPGSGGSDVADIEFVDGTLYFTADDGIHGRELWALLTNIAPWFTTPSADTAIENVEYRYTAGVTDANEGDTLTLSLVDAPDGVQFDVETGLLTWTPASAGLVTITLAVTDGSESATQTLRVEVLSDVDADTVPDGQDNCTNVLNPDQRDTNGDGFGNVCDADLNNDGIVNFSDLSILVNLVFSSDPDADLDGDGSVNFGDVAIFRDLFLMPPGPSGTVF
ncbi:MAG: putative Ig domain-containing protein, partial [Gammaproteobacteria bacterium]